MLFALNTLYPSSSTSSSFEYVTPLINSHSSLKETISNLPLCLYIVSLYLSPLRLKSPFSFILFFQLTMEFKGKCSKSISEKSLLRIAVMYCFMKFVASGKSLVLSSFLCALNYSHHSQFLWKGFYLFFFASVLSNRRIEVFTPL